MPRTKGSKNRPKTNITKDYASQIAEKQETITSLNTEIASITVNIDTLKVDLKEKKTTVAGRAAKEKEKELEKWLRGLDGMERLVEDYGGQIPLWEKIMDRQGSVCCVWEKTAFEEGLKVGIRLMTEVYGA